MIRITTAFGFLFATLPLLALDVDGDGMCDVWEARYHATALLAGADEDGDNISNLDESRAGTNPSDPNSRHTASIASQAGALQVSVVSQLGKSYQLTSCLSLDGPWLPVGSAIAGNGNALDLTASAAGGKGFFRVAVTDADADGDGLNDWAERQLSGFDPNSADTFGAGVAGNDLAVATEMLQMLRDGNVSVEVTSATAYEKENEAAGLTVSRSSAPGYPMTLFLKPGGATNSTKSSAANDDYALKNQANQVVTRLVIPAGEFSASLSITPTTDTKNEVPEQLQVFIGGSTLEGTVAIADAKPVEANQRLLVAYLGASPGISTLGRGIATILLEGDNDFATVAVSFSNLNSPVNSVQVLNTSSLILQSIPPATYGGQLWSIRASQSFSTDQSVLDALLSGSIKLGVYTMANVSGEIEGPFLVTSGSTTFQTPPAATPVGTLSGTALDRDIVRFLTQATFGPTPALITDLQTRVANAGGNQIAAYSTWIDEQFTVPSPSLLAYTTAANQQEILSRAALFPTDPAFDPNNNNRRRGWWLHALHAPDHLRQRVAFALSEIFVISEVDSLIAERSYGAASYYDMLRTNASGSYRDLLEGVSTHPMMGYYLSHLRNSKATFTTGGVVVTSPDENYAREIMQLFSIGLVQLHPDGSLKLGSNGLPITTYTQTDITEMARVFTGWSFSQRNSPSNSNTVIANTSFTYGNGTERFEAQWTTPMAMFAANHDTGAKSMIGLSLPADQTGQKDLTDVVNHLSNHSNTAPFICRRLIQRLVTSNPSAGYLYRVSSVFSSSGGNFPAVVKAILLDPEARSQSQALSLTSSGKPREPIVRATAFLRAFGAKSQLPLSDLTAYGFPSTELAKFPVGTTRPRLNNSNSTLAQSPLAAPTVFNWFLPDYSPSGLLAANGLNSPELQLANENTVIQSSNFIYSPAFGGSPSVSSLVDQNLPPYSYGTSAHNVLIDVTPLNALYMAVVDVNGDGLFTNLDVGTFNNATKIAEACTAVVDRIDFLLCAGGLNARYGNTAGKPRKVILDAVASIQSGNNGSNSSGNQATYMRDRIRAALWLVSSSPECVIQK